MSAIFFIIDFYLTFSKLKTRVSERWLLGLFFRTTSSNCSTSAGLSGGNLPVDTTQCQLHQWWRAHHCPRGGILHGKWELEWPAASGLPKLQDWAPGPGHRVWDQRAPHQARGGRHWISGTSPQNKNQVCWWVWEAGLWSLSLWVLTCSVGVLRCLTLPLLWQHSEQQQIITFAWPQ